MPLSALTCENHMQIICKTILQASGRNGKLLFHVFAKAAKVPKGLVLQQLQQYLFPLTSQDANAKLSFYSVSERRLPKLQSIW